MEKRDESLDILRTIGILGIFLAHVEPSFWIKQLRIFDVILMVIISGYLFEKPQNYIKYVVKRIKRLVLPTYVALSLFFIILYFLERFFDIKVNILNIKTVVLSYLLISGIGFVWIIRIYLGVAIVAPIILKNITFKKLILYYIILEIILNLSLYNFDLPKVEVLVFQLLPYCLLFCYGNLLKKKKVPIKKLTIILVVILVIGKYILKNLELIDFKYPPRLFYIYYGVFVTNILFLIKDRIKIKSIWLKKFTGYIGKSTMWFYLIHIFIFYLLRFVEKKFEIHWIIEYLILVIASLTILYFKDIILKILRKTFGEEREVIKLFEG